MTFGAAQFTVDIALRVGIAARLIMSRRPTPVVLAWLMLLLAPVPWVGVVVYAIVGEVRLGSWRVRRYHQLLQRFGVRTALFWRERPLEWAAECDPYKQIADVATLVGDIPPVRGNTLTVLGNAE